LCPYLIFCLPPPFFPVQKGRKYGKMTTFAPLQKANHPKKQKNEETNMAIIKSVKGLTPKLGKECYFS
jgi:hypothetical protein